MERDTDSKLLEEVVNVLELSEEDLNISQAMSTALAEWIRSQNISLIVLNNAMTSNVEEYFWKKDYHLNTAGHLLIADLLYKNRQLWLKK